jgi:hypothetical protein
MIQKIEIKKTFDSITFANFSLILNIEQWCKIDERLYVPYTDEQYKQYGGSFVYDEEIIKNLAEMKLKFQDFY